MNDDQYAILKSLVADLETCIAMRDILGKEDTAYFDTKIGLRIDDLAHHKTKFGM